MPIFGLLMADMIDVLARFDVYRNYRLENIILNDKRECQQWKDLRNEAL